METGRARVEEQILEPPQPTPFAAPPEPAPQDQAPTPLPQQQFQAPPTEPLSMPPPAQPAQPVLAHDQQASAAHAVMPAPAPMPPAASEPPASGSGNIEQIRDIIFGVQMRDYERRFSTLEARLTQEAATLRDDIRARFDALELAMRQQFNALSESLGTERDNRTGAVAKVNDDVRVLRDDAADRRALAAMFTEMARRLDGGNGSNGSHGNNTPDAQ